MTGKTMTPGQVADIIERFLAGSGLYPQEFNDFFECRLSDPKLDTYRERCEILHGEFEPRRGQLILLSIEEAQRQAQREAAAIKELDRVVGELRLLERETQKDSTSRTSRHPAWLLAGFWFCVVVALAVAVRRFLALIRPSPGSRPPQMEALDATFASHATLTLMHIIPAAIFVVLAVCVLLRRSRSDWLERLFFSFGAITGATAYAMSSYAIGGWVERSAVLVFTSWFLFSLGRAFWFRLGGQEERKREWMTRAVAVLLGIATARPVMGVFFATSARTHLGPSQFFGIAFWTGFTINTVIIELWLRSKRDAQLQVENVDLAVS